jgi:hypothetical protein
MTAKKVWPGTKPFWTIWNPDSEKPSKVQFQTLEHAERVAKEMAIKYGEAFVVMKAVKRIEVPPPPRVKITDYE